ncbi:MAG TPA: hypothetical protein VNG12_13620 [Acidimicrobiales bacterium]|nr:hypothetical protein [Acidimicrobiales bacterium]
MVGSVEHIAVDPMLWISLAGADMAEYFIVAQRQSIWLQVRPAAPDGLVVGRLPASKGDPRTIATEGFDGTIDASACSRAPWEHRLRQLLELNDPCF